MSVRDGYEGGFLNGLGGFSDRAIVSWSSGLSHGGGVVAPARDVGVVTLTSDLLVSAEGSRPGRGWEFHEEHVAFDDAFHAPQSRSAEDCVVGRWVVYYSELCL